MLITINIAVGSIGNNNNNNIDIAAIAITKCIVDARCRELGDREMARSWGASNYRCQIDTHSSRYLNTHLR